MSSEHQHLRDIYEAAIAAVHGRHCVRAALHGIELDAPVQLVAIGKAACAMTQGALDALDGRIHQALVITKYGHVKPALGTHPRLTVLEAGHPIPDRRSLDASAHLLKFLGEASADTTFIFLISGGASALVEVLPTGFNAADLARANQWLQASGLPIAAMNHLRKQWSCIKGGRLVRHLNGRRTLNLLISDVPDDCAGDIGSGLLVPDAADRVAAPLGALPPWLVALTASATSAPVPDGKEAACVETHLVATAAMAQRAALAAARRLDYEVGAQTGQLAGDAAAEGRRLARWLMGARPGIYIWSGETTVILPEHPGRGGRNQHLALAAADEMAGCPGLLLLAVATDGGDGPGDVAGALVDGGTVARGAVAGLSSGSALKAADSGRFLDAAGALIRTGPTGTNVMDLVIGLRSAARCQGNG
jgi:hydroxypyruvate reductase